MRWRVTVSKGNQSDRERKDSGTSEVLEANSWSLVTSLALRSTNDAMEEMSPITAAASAMTITSIAE